MPKSTTHSDTTFSFADVSTGRVAVRNGFPWNACDAYLFDILTRLTPTRYFDVLSKFEAGLRRRVLKQQYADATV